MPWTHNSILVERISDPDERVWYAEKCLENGWNKVVLDHQIDLNLYARSKDRDINKLMEYARILKIEKEVRSQMEVLLSAD